MSGSGRPVRAKRVSSALDDYVDESSTTRGGRLTSPSTSTAVVHPKSSPAGAATTAASQHHTHRPTINTTTTTATYIPPTPSSLSVAAAALSPPPSAKRARVSDKYALSRAESNSEAAAVVAAAAAAGITTGAGAGGAGAGGAGAGASMASGGSNSGGGGGGGGGAGAVSVLPLTTFSVGYAGIPGATQPILPPGVGYIEGGTLSASGESLFFALNDAYTAEIARRADMVVCAGKGSWGAPGFTGPRSAGDINACILAAEKYRGLLRRKNALVWQTRLMIERTSLNAGHFDHPLLAAVAYDFAQTFLRPGMKNANGTNIALNFPNTASDTRIVPVTTDRGLKPVFLEQPGVPHEDGHFWSKDEAYYEEIKLRATGLLTSKRVAPLLPGDVEPIYVGIQKHKRKKQLDVADPSTYTWEGKLIYRRKWFYLGRFKTQLEAAAA